ncbi:pilus assembly protein N-terminal domain-containing protein [Achromobacter sp. SIMBA_011]|uniref:Type 3 secretion system secretin n=2 Tax=Achromobacter dolens TaxID=1287738 RepID=A0A6S7BUL5_9BURK|nr:pilus assembly protein N-terminal domain-containing protein [Achromobacter dolens]OAS95410.1 type II secretion system protein [Achromobacter xylosoxidans]MCZ8407726.1 pilus assembly protein N-terminal domain-containing protein [Achromobacter dolens]CAB3705388.1 Type 3 secretion system secretin [Achromobacter dolens]CAB3819038.1 Type 3 secretion system secretin [Achromobacter dolens]CUJ50898.1 Pullulanase secretion envelope pulD [Achromobacter dolens]
MTYGVAGMAQTAIQSDPGAGAPARDIAVAVRGQQTLMLEGAPARIAIGDPEVADVKVLAASGKRQASLLLYGKKPGTTQLQVWTGNNAAPQLWTVRVAGNVQQVMAGRGMAGGANVDVAGDRAVVSGQADSPLSHQASVAAAGAVVGDKNVVDVSTAGTGGVVQVEVKVVEVSRSVMKQAGISFAGRSGPWGGTNSITPDGFPAPLGFSKSAALASGFSLFYDSNDFSARLRLLQNNGMARVLAEPTLVALTGQSASFLAGGELPIPEAGGLGTTTVTFKPFGIGLTVTPTVLSRERIALKVAPEASELDYSNAIAVSSGTNTTTLIPALRTRRADTTVELGDGESFVVSGLVSRQTKALVNKVPMLGDLPIIGSFFRSVDYTQEDTELVIVVTPRLVRPIARGVTLPLPGARQEATDTAFNAWGYYLMGPAGGQQMPGFSR